MEGRYHSGKSAATHVVTVTPGDGGLMLAGQDYEAFWPAAKIRVVQRSGPVWRLTTADDPDCRLSIDKGAEIDAALLRLRVTGAAADLSRHLGFMSTLIAASAAIAALVFLVVPLAATPLARATPRPVESRLGENLSAQILLVMKPCGGGRAREAEAALAPVVDELYRVAQPGFAPDVTFVHEDSPNAFAMPGGRIMVTSGLLDILDDPDELEAVLAHEVGHVQHRDGMVALYRNAGLGILLEVITGGSGLAQQIVALGGQLAQLRYTRIQEEAADREALVSLRKAGRDPAALARAFRTLKKHLKEEAETGPRIEKRLSEVKIPEWLLSHPDLDSRIARAEAAAHPVQELPLSAASWASVRAACGA